jgi:hypothetical protein
VAPPLPLCPGRAPRQGLPTRSYARRSNWPAEKVPPPLKAGLWLSPDRARPNAFLGREQVLEDLGFTCVDWPSPERVIMRLELGGN